MIARDDPAEPVREGLNEESGERTDPIAGDHEQLERWRIIEPLGPLAAQHGNEPPPATMFLSCGFRNAKKPALVRPLLGVPNKTRCLTRGTRSGSSSKARCTTSPPMLWATSASVWYCQRRHLETCPEMNCQNGQIGVGRPHAAYIGQQAGAVAEAQNVPFAERGFGPGQRREQAPRVLVAAAEAMEEHDRAFDAVPSSDLVDAMAG